MVGKVRLWRWRRNPLRRRTDVTEAWVVLVFGTLAVVGVPVAGAVTAWGVEDSLLRQREDRHLVSAVLTENAPTVVTYSGHGQVRATVRWTASDGSARTGDAPVESGSAAGTRAGVWLDRQGHLTEPPAGTAMAEAEGGLAGTVVAGAAWAVLAGGLRTVRWGLDRRRATEWDREWAEVGPQWGHRRA